MSVFAQTRSWVGSGLGRQNEDYACVDVEARCAVLVDGATGLTGINLVEGQSDAAWYARSLATEAFRRMVGDAELSGSAALGLSGHEVAESYLSLTGSRELTAADRPNGSAAVLRWDDESVEVTMLGDCTAVVLLANGEASVVHDGTLDALDQANYRLMHQYAVSEGTTMAEARRALNDCFVSNRLLLNEKGGYWAADVSCRGFGHELVRSYPTNEVSDVLLCSDGFVAAVEMGVVSGLAELARIVADGGGEELGRALRAAEQKDSGLWRHPRSKISDDATYVLVSL